MQIPTFLLLSTVIKLRENVRGKISLKPTVWKFQNFSIIQILRETKVGDFRGPKIAILTHLEALIFDIYEFLHFLKD